MMTAAPTTMDWLAFGSERVGYEYRKPMARAAELAMIPMIVNACIVLHSEDDSHTIAPLASRPLRR